MTSKESAVIACEVKISVAGKSFEEIRKLIERLHEACTGNYKLEVNFVGDFLKNQSSEAQNETV